jgi:hypothetical protein
VRKLNKIACMAILSIAISATSLLISSRAQAVLMGVDFLASGDQLLTRDPSAGLDWLDLTVTLGLSYNEASVSEYVTDHGFRFANVDEVTSLYISAGGVTVPGSGPQNLAAVLLLLDLMGCTTQCVNGEPAGQGYFNTTVPDPTQASYSFYQGAAILNAGEFTIADFPTAAPKDLPVNAPFWRNSTGSFFVRNVAVPEPTTIAIFTLGLLGLGAARRRRHYHRT